MGTRGPVPKRDAQRAGHRSKSERAQVIEMPGGVTAPAPAQHWAPEMRALYVSFTESGQHKFFEPTDWHVLHMTVEQLDANAKSSRPSSEMFKACMAVLDSLGATEGARRRQRIEIERPNRGNAEPTNPDATDDAKAAVSARFAALRAVGRD